MISPFFVHEEQITSVGSTDDNSTGLARFSCTVRIFSAMSTFFTRFPHFGTLAVRASCGLFAHLYCTVSGMLYEVDLILGITWLQETNPLIDWSSGTLYIPDSQSMIRLFGEWLQSKYQTGTVKILYSHEEIESLKNPAVTEKINVIANPRFWQFENCKSSFSFKGDEKWKNRYCTYTSRSSSGV